MRSAVLLTVAMAILSFGFTGCHTITVHRGAACVTDECSSTAKSDCGCGPLRGGCGPLRCGLLGGRGAHLLGRAGMGTPYTESFAGPDGPMTPTVSYPYYTTRAPRDFLDSNPPSIGR